ncbi:hypothetical protein a10_08224 [Streptomyces acidiscabies]|nr:hypothetical protein a10_08224 [Streptomyces acidiscabies]
MAGSVSVAVTEARVVTRWASAAREASTPAPEAAPVPEAAPAREAPPTVPAAATSTPSGPNSTARPPVRWASCRSTAGTGSGRDAAAARLCWASVTRRSSEVRARSINCHTARATAANVVSSGTSISGNPYDSQAATRARGTVSWTGATPNPRATPPAAITLET